MPLYTIPSHIVHVIPQSVAAKFNSQYLIISPCSLHVNIGASSDCAHPSIDLASRDGAMSLASSTLSTGSIPHWTDNLPRPGLFIIRGNHGNHILIKTLERPW